jgi:hypothetical protein
VLKNDLLRHIRRALVPALFSLSLSATAQIAPGPGVNPRTVWSEPPEIFESSRG